MPKKKQECTSCGYSGLVTGFDVVKGEARVEVYYCDICANSPSGITIYNNHITQDTIVILKTMCYIGNMIIKELRSIRNG